MADRLVNENDVLALIDAKIDACDRLLSNPLTRQMDRKMLASNISVLRTIAGHLEFIPEASLTETDMARIAADNDAGQPGALECLA
jgi:hypothetical protein